MRHQITVLSCAFLMGRYVSECFAGGCRFVAQKVVQKQVLAEVVPNGPLIQAVQIHVPLYNFSYSQQQAQAYQQELAQPVDCCQQLVEELAKLRAELASLRPGGAPPNGQAVAPPGVGIMANKCAVCHTAGKEPKGELELFDMHGKRVPLSLTAKNRLKRRVLSGDMPKPLPGQPHQPLTDAEKEAFFRELEQ